MKGFIEKFLVNPPLLVFVLGLALFVIAAFGQLPVGENILVVNSQPWRIALGVVGLFCIAWGGFVLKFGTTRPPPITFDYDIFVASPMASLKPGEYNKQMQDALAIIAALQEYCGIKSAYFAGKKITTPDKFDPPDVAAEVDLEAIRKSRAFLMLYPSKVARSVLFEAGFALALGRTSIYFVSENIDLPFMMKSLEKLSRKYPDVKIYFCRDADDIVNTIKAAGGRLIPKWTQPAHREPE